MSKANKCDTQAKGSRNRQRHSRNDNCRVPRKNDSYYAGADGDREAQNWVDNPLVHFVGTGRGRLRGAQNVFDER